MNVFDWIAVVFGVASVWMLLYVGRYRWRRAFVGWGWLVPVAVGVSVGVFLNTMGA